jgi:biofilm protein TabA
MIVTDLEHAAEQIALTPALQKGLAFLRQVRSQTLADGRVEIDGSQVYALVQSYDTQGGEPKFEAHRKYLDIQYIAAGEEVIGWAGLDRMSVDTPYDEAKDACLGRVPASDMTPVRLSAGQLAVLYPSDAHAPKLAAGAPGPVKKIVVKVAV